MLTFNLDSTGRIHIASTHASRGERHAWIYPNNHSPIVNELGSITIATEANIDGGLKGDLSSFTLAEVDWANSGGGLAVPADNAAAAQLLSDTFFGAGSIGSVTIAGGATEAKQNVIITELQTISGGGATTTTQVPVISSATSVVIAAANANRKQLVISNKADQPMYINLAGTAATIANGHELPAGDTWIEDKIKNAITAIWTSTPAAPVGNAIVSITV